MRRIPSFDITKINSTYNQTRLRRQADGRRKGILYFSNYVGLGTYMRNDNQLRRLMSRKAWATRKALGDAIGRSTRGEDGHLADTLVVKKRVPGGVYNDRMTYDVYSTQPNRFIPAILAKEGAIKKAMMEVRIIG